MKITVTAADFLFFSRRVSCLYLISAFQTSLADVKRNVDFYPSIFPDLSFCSHRFAPLNHQMLDLKTRNSCDGYMIVRFHLKQH